MPPASKRARNGKHRESGRSLKKDYATYFAQSKQLRSCTTRHPQPGATLQRFQVLAEKRAPRLILHSSRAARIAVMLEIDPSAISVITQKKIPLVPAILRPTIPVPCMW